MNDIKRYIRNIPDFPKKGILFRDITPLIGNKDVFKYVIDTFAKRYRNKGIDKIVAPEARGFIFASALAYALNVGFVPVRKKGKLPHKTIGTTYQLEYGIDSLHIHVDAIRRGQRTLIFDDLLATGGTAKAICELVEKTKGSITELAFIIELTDLNGREKLKGHSVFSLIKY